MTDAVLEVTDLSAGYHKRLVFESVSLALEPGEWYVLLGPNGCGKSTLLDCIVGRHQPASGNIRIAGYTLPTNPAQAKRRLGYACAPHELPPLLTARQCLEVHAGAKGLATLDSDVMSLSNQLGFDPYWDCFVDTLSLGTRQKLAILLALVGDPQLIVLDEAFNGLDPSSSFALKRHLKRRLQERGSALILATHALDIVEHFADRAALLLNGTLQREWGKSAMDATRQSDQGFEEAMFAEPSR